MKIAILGGGISGLAAAYAIEQGVQQQGIDATTILFEKDDRTGGKIRSIHAEGYLCEWGPNGFLDNKPMTLDLCSAIGVSDRLLRSNDNARKRFIYSAGKLNRLPESPPSFLKSDLISWPGKFRLAMEMLIPAGGSGDETLAAFARRRLGQEALDKLIGPMVSGIFAGDPETMSLKSCFPRIHQLEQEYGGLIRAMLKLAGKKRKEQKEGKVVASAAGPGGVLTSFAGGIQDLTDYLTSAVKAERRLGNAVLAIEKQESGYLLKTEQGSETVDLVVSAIPAYALAQALQGMLPAASTQLDAIPYAAMQVVCFGYDEKKIDLDLNGFGYLNAKGEKCNTLGTLWDSSIFARRAPDGKVLLRSMVGGATRPEAKDFTEAEVIDLVKADLKRIMGIDTEPDFIRVFRHEQAIPQYTVGHADRVAAVEGALEAFPGIFLAGNAFGGVGINDCVNAANKTAEKVLDYLSRKG